MTSVRHTERFTSRQGQLLSGALLLGVWLPQVLLCGVLFAGLAFAEDERAEVSLGVSASVTAAGTIWTGQQVTLDLDLKTPALSFADIHFNLPDVPGALVLRADTTTVKLTEQRDGEVWQVLRYPITLFPQQAGRVSVPAFDVRFQTLEGFGSEPIAHRLVTTPLTLEIRQPPGLPPEQIAVTTTRLQLTSDWNLPGENLKAGDAVTLTVERQAAGLSAMLLPPVPVAELPGLAAYPEDPDIDDRTNRGTLTGVRRDRITWVIEQAGDYTLPALVFRNWDPARERLETQKVEGVSFQAAPSPRQASASTADTRSMDRSTAGSALRNALLFLTLATALLALAWHFRAQLGIFARHLKVRILPPARALLRTLNPGTPS